MEEVVCRICGEMTTYTGTRLCNNCWEVESRLERFARSENGRAYMKEVLAKEEVRNGFQSNGKGQSDSEN